MEENTHRSGIDRRSQNIDVDVERRKGTEQRAVLKYYKRMIDITEKIPVFNGLTIEQNKKLLNVCYQKTLLKDTYIYKQGEKSDAFFILIKGQLKIFRNKIFLSNIYNTDIIGLVDVLSGIPRLTSVITTDDSTIIKINKTELFRLLRNDYHLSNRIFMNLSDILAKKIHKYMELIDELQNKSHNMII